MPVGILVDTTKCTGCRGCQSACKQWNMLPGWGEIEEYNTTFNAKMTNPRENNAHTYNHVEFFEIDDEDKFKWIFVHKRCLHCSYPACVSVCPVGALHKRANGPVLWDKDKCFGCRYCQNACPFDIPKFEWEEAWPKISKCTFCWNRLEDGMQPACAKTCPSGALKFGERADLLAEAHDRISEHPEVYYEHIYGEHEAGGTALLYINAVAPEKLGFKHKEEEMYPNYTWEFLSRIPIEIAIIFTLLVGIYIFRSKRTNKEEVTTKS